MGQGTHVTGIGSAFEAVNKHDLGLWLRRSLGLDKNLDIGLGLVEAAGRGERTEIEGAGPEITEDGERVWVRDDGDERAHGPV